VSGPIVDPVVLNREYAVEGCTWERPGFSACAILRRESDGAGIVVRDLGGLATTGASDWAPEALVAAGCAALGIPTPQALAREVAEWLERAQEIDYDDFDDLRGRLASIGGEP
jgi:hypothetical protein